MDELRECYATLTTPFGAPGRFYDELGHRGADYDRDAGETIIAYDDMRVDYVASTTGLGTVVGLRRLTIGGWAGFAHIAGRPALGSIIELGEPIALVASSSQAPGSLWSGPHIHTTESWESAYAAALGIRPLTDPAPTIAAALASSQPAGQDRQPIDNQEDEMAASVIIKQITGSGRNTLWHLPDDNSAPTAIRSMDEVRSLIATGAVRKVNPTAPGVEAPYIIVPKDDAILTLRQALAARKP